MDILNDYSAKDSRINVISINNLGVSQARNIAIKNSTSNYLMFVDSDDWIDETTCEVAVNKALSNDSDLVIWNYIRELPDNPLPKQIFNNSEIIFDEQGVRNNLKNAFTISICLIHCYKMMHFPLHHYIYVLKPYVGAILPPKIMQKYHEKQDSIQ